MVELKKISMTICLAFFLLFSAKANAYDSNIATFGFPEIDKKVTLNKCNIESKGIALKNCTITIKNDNGTQLEVTFHDVTWFQCAKIKVGKWLKDIF